MKVAPGVTLIHTRIGQSLLLEGPPVTLIDTGAPGSLPRILKALKRIGFSAESVHQIVITHSHSDHIGTAAELRALSGARVLIHIRDDGVATGRIPPYPPMPRGISGFLGKPFVQQFARMSAFPPVEIDGYLDDGDTIDPGIQVIGTPGHTPGHVSIYLPDHRLLHAGDALVNIMGVRPPLAITNQDRNGVHDSIVRLADEPFRRLTFGHGAPLFRGARNRVARLARRYQTSRK